ncbi:MAG TPA: 50S ribosomal protein L18 [candidate division WWE3 bacterium]|uniref:Large ribosomal subunit protein uL18 n=1 Tax=candidate division WWE3 bacterium TaxID=2053526 RepID=A0A7C1DGF8_UNCKA|nr:50S ribosomal protein L18 [candidate division WWE3 bacterium]
MLRTNKKATKQRRTKRTRSKIYGTPERPRLVVFRSNKYIYAQLVDDTKGMTLATIDSLVIDAHKKGTKVEASFELGKKMAEVAKNLGVDTVIFDKRCYRYHGRVKSFAEGAREGNLAF